MLAHAVAIAERHWPKRHLQPAVFGPGNGASWSAPAERRRWAFTNEAASGLLMRWMRLEHLPVQVLMAGNILSEKLNLPGLRSKRPLAGRAVSNQEIEQ